MIRTIGKLIQGVLVGHSTDTGLMTLGVPRDAQLAPTAPCEGKSEDGRTVPMHLVRVAPGHFIAFLIEDPHGLIGLKLSGDVRNSNQK